MASLDKITVEINIEIACAFAEWIDRYGYEYHKDKSIWTYFDSGMNKYTTKELFQLFLKEHEL